MTKSNTDAENQDALIQLLEEFKQAVIHYSNGDDIEEDGIDLRTYINRNSRAVQSLVWRAHCEKLVTVSPPPAVGGMIMRNINPFEHIFNGPYGMDMTSVVTDMIDETIGVIQAGHLPPKPDLNQKSNRIAQAPSSNHKVFIVHGRDEEVKQSVARFLEKLGLEAVVLHERSNTGKTIIEKFEKHSDVAFAVVLMTPDDCGGIKAIDPVLRDRARQNVIFELGYFMGKLGRDRVSALLKGDIERPSDSDGIVYIALDPNDGWKILLAKELKEAGLLVDLNKVV
jgi:predicted nucleotide-binding protein